MLLLWLQFQQRFCTTNWLKIYHNHCFQVKRENINSIIIGNSILAGLTLFTNIWENLFGNRFINLNIFNCGILSHNKSFSVNRLIINEVNNPFKFKCSSKNFQFINQNNGWTLHIVSFIILLRWFKVSQEKQSQTWQINFGSNWF